MDKTLVFNPEITSVYDAMNFYMSYHEQLIISYIHLIREAKSKGIIDIEANKRSNDAVNELFNKAKTFVANPKSDNSKNNEEKIIDSTTLKAESISIFESMIFTDYIDKFISETKDHFELKKAYHLISKKLNDLTAYHIRIEFNSEYKFTRFDFSLSKSEEYGGHGLLGMFLWTITAEKTFFKSTQNEVLDFGITADNIFDAIVQDFENTKTKIDNSFSFLVPNISTKLNKGNETPVKQIEPIRLDANQTQIVYLFKSLIAEGLINESLNPKLWSLVATYFTDKDNSPLNNIHQTKTNLENTKTGKPKQKADTIENIVKGIKKPL